MKNKFLLLIAAPALLTACGKKEKTTVPELKTITETVYASGILVPENEYVLRAQTEGTIKEIYVREGDSVASGKVLLEILNNRTGSDLETAAEIYATTLQTTGPSAPALAEAESRLSSATVKFRTDSLNYLRYKKLLAEKAASQNEFEQVELRYTQSKTDLTAARKQVDLLRLNLDNERIRAKGNLLSAETGADYRRPKAAYASLVYELNKKAGDYIRPGDALALLGAGRLIAKLKIDESDFAKVHPGQKVLITGDVFGDEVKEGRVLRVLPRMNEREQSFTVEAELPNTGLPSVYGLNIEADIIIAEERQALLIPKEFLLPGDSVQIKKDDALATVKVKTGLISGNYVEVTQGIDTQTQLVKR